MSRKVLRKTELMHELFGKEEGRRCQECAHLIKIYYHGKILKKCCVYGLTHSEASDWRQKYEACGLINKPYTGRKVIELVKRGFQCEETHIPGQYSFDFDKRED